MASRRVFILHLRPEPRIDAIRALRGALKTLLKLYGLRAVRLYREPAPDAAEDPQDVRGSMDELDEW